VDIKPVDQTVKTLLESFFYRIPRFQRHYSWDRENVADFWNDAITSDDPDYFIGSFVVYRETAAADTLLVVDGQQRSLIRYVLVRLDEHFRKNAAVDYNKMAIEHIAPQKPRSGEPSAPPNVGSVGNLILVPEKLNNEVLGNKPFLKKRDMYNAHDVAMDDILATATSWTAVEIDSRMRSLATLLQDRVFRV
jgi:hypothetical protein